MCAVGRSICTTMRFYTETCIFHICMKWVRRWGRKRQNIVCRTPRKKKQTGVRVSFLPLLDLSHFYCQCMCGSSISVIMYGVRPLCTTRNWYPLSAHANSRMLGRVKEMWKIIVNYSSNTHCNSRQTNRHADRYYSIYLYVYSRTIQTEHTATQHDLYIKGTGYK